MRKCCTHRPIAGWQMTRIGQVFQPEPGHASTYDQLYRRVYRRLYQRLQPLYRDIRAITGYPAKD